MQSNEPPIRANVMRVYKTKGEEKNTEQITVPLPRYVMEKLKKVAEKVALSKTELARQLIRDGLDNG